ncbi:MAG: hypothetical protein WCK90_00525 [archaeon]
MKEKCPCGCPDFIYPVMSRQSVVSGNRFFSAPMNAISFNPHEHSGAVCVACNRFWPGSDHIRSFDILAVEPKAQPEPIQPATLSTERDDKMQLLYAALNGALANEEFAKRLPINEITQKVFSAVGEAYDNMIAEEIQRKENEL